MPDNEIRHDAQAVSADLSTHAHNKYIAALLAFKKELTVAAIALAAVLIIYGALKAQQSAAEQDANLAYLLTTNLPDGDTSIDEKLEKFVAAHKGTSAAIMAEMSLMQHYFDKDDRVKAAEVAKRFIDSHADHFFTPQVRIDYGALLEWQGKATEAMAQYQKVLASNRDYLFGEAKLGIARCLELSGKTEDAKAKYQELISGRNDHGNMTQRIVSVAAFRMMALREGNQGMAPGTIEAASAAAAATTAK